MVQQGELQGFDYAPSYPTASSQGIGFHRRQLFSGGPVTRSKRTHQWMSGVAMLVRWLCSFPASELLALVDPFVLPRPQEMHPSATKGYVNQQAASFQRPPKQVISGGLAVTGLGKECTLTPSIRSESELLDLFTDGHFQSSRIPRKAEKAKTKASDQSRGE